MKAPADSCVAGILLNNEINKICISGRVDCSSTDITANTNEEKKKQLRIVKYVVKFIPV